MFHRTCDTMRTEHPPYPLHKGDSIVFFISLSEQFSPLLCYLYII